MLARWAGARLRRIKDSDFALRRLVAELAERGLKVDYPSVWEFVHAEKLSFKKSVVAGERDRPDVTRRRANGASIKIASIPSGWSLSTRLGPGPIWLRWLGLSEQDWKRVKIANNDLATFRSRLSMPSPPVYDPQLPRRQNGDAILPCLQGQLRERADLVEFHQTAIPVDIGREDGRSTRSFAMSAPCEKLGLATIRRKLTQSTTACPSRPSVE
jgi:hypothetical protein